jgi:hypothetical protein
MGSMTRLVEECTGVGDLVWNGQVVRQVRYRFNVYQGSLEGSAMPVPGLRTIDGSIDFDPARDPADLVGVNLSLKLEDGRHLGIHLADREGRIAAPHPSSCACCC